MNPHVCFQIEIKRKPLVAEITLVWLFACVDQHVPFELRIVQKSLSAAIVRALEELVSMDRVMLFQTCPIMEYLSA